MAGTKIEKPPDIVTSNKQKQYQEEKAETGKVSWRIYLLYWRNMGYALFSSSFTLFAIYQGFTAFSSVWLSLWADNRLPFTEINDTRNTNMTEDEQEARRDLYLGVYGALGLAQVLEVTVLPNNSTGETSSIGYIPMLNPP